jgi:ADP-heptose:LPS heptosyltransferase
MLDFSYLAGAFAFFCGVPIRIGFDREGEGFFFNRTAQYGARVYDADSYLKLGKLVGADSRKRPMRIFLTDKEKYFARKFFKEHNLVQSRTVAISPGGAKNPAYDMDAKRWPAERFAEVAEELAKIGKVILVVGGPGDVQFAKAIINKVPKAVNAAGMFSLRETAALIARASRLVCVDSGLMHVSVAVGTPVVAIFGPTDPMKLAPRGREHRILWKHPDKMPCYVDGVLHECPDKNRCIDRVSVTDVIRVLE